jgi:hypothetical protein
VPQSYKIMIKMLLQDSKKEDAILFYSLKVLDITVIVFIALYHSQCEISLSKKVFYVV